MNAIMIRLRRRSKSFTDVPSKVHNEEVSRALIEMHDDGDTNTVSIIVAATLGDIVRVRRICTSIEPTVVTEHEWETAFVGASSAGNLDVLRIMLDTRIHEITDYSLALSAARANKHPHVVDMLLREMLGMTPDNEAISAAAHGDMALVSAILSPQHRLRKEQSFYYDNDANNDDDAMYVPKKSTSERYARSLGSSPIRRQSSPILTDMRVTSELLKNMHAAAVVNNRPEVVYAILQSPRARAIIDVHRARLLAVEKGYADINAAIDAAMSINGSSSSKR